jgi:hypothetical protein
VQWSIWNFPFKLCRDPSPSSTYMEHHSPCNRHKGKAPSGICPKVHAFQSSQTCTATTTAAATATAAATSAGRRRSQEAQVCKLEEYDGPLCGQWTWIWSRCRHRGLRRARYLLTACTNYGTLSVSVFTSICPDRILCNTTHISHVVSFDSHFHPG